MMTIRDYFETIRAAEGYEAEAEAEQALVEMIEADFEDDGDRVAEWAEAEGIDLEAGHICRGCFFTYFEEWCWDNFEE